MPENPELTVLKRNFPFRLGCTSWVLPDYILPNVEFLAGKIEAIQLLIFEDDSTSNYPTADEVKRLVELAEDNDMVYSVHLPMYQRLGSRDENERIKGRDAILRAIDATIPINPFAFDLHLEPDEYDIKNPVHDLTAWQDQHRKSLTELIERGVPTEKIGIETLEYPFEWVDDIVFDLDFNVCLDIGHVWKMNYDEQKYLQRYLPLVRNVHLHGIRAEDNKDHQPLNHLTKTKLLQFFEALEKTPYKREDVERMVCIEVFGAENLAPSLEFLSAL